MNQTKQQKIRRKPRKLFTNSSEACDIRKNNKNRETMENMREAIRKQLKLVKLNDQRKNLKTTHKKQNRAQLKLLE
jgi:hypothetical protein